MKAEQVLTGSRATISSFMAMIKKELTIMTRYPVEFVASFGQVFIIIVVLTLSGMVFAEPGKASEGQTAVRGLVAYGFVQFLFISDILWSIGYHIRREQKQGTLEQLYLSPATKFGVLASRVTLTLVWGGLTSLMAVVGLALLLGKLPFHNAGLSLLVLLLSLSGSFGLGFAFAALTLRIKQASETAVNLLQFVVMIFCAPFFPFSALPKSLLAVARLIPLSYGVDAFRSALMGYPSGFPELAPIGVELAILTLFGLVMPPLGYWLFRKAEHDARQRGNLSEY